MKSRCHPLAAVRIVFAAVLLCCASASAAPGFSAARPVWPEGRERRMNDFVEFRASFEAETGDSPVLRVTGSSVYRIRLNGDFVGYGPARAAKGFFRVDEWPLAAKQGRNDLTVEVSAYNCNNFYIPDQPAFLQAEVVAGGKVLAATRSGGDFAAFDTPRVVKTSRYSYQRAFGEAYRLSPGWEGAALPLTEQPSVRLVERIAPYPKPDGVKSLRPVSSTAVSWNESAPIRKCRWVDDVKPWFKCYKADELEANLWYDLQRTKTVGSDAAPGGKLAAGRGTQYDAGLDATGFVGMEVTCRRPGTLWLAFDEILVDGLVQPLRFSICNAVRYELAPGRYRLETFEPYTFRYLHVYSFDGEFEVVDPFVRAYRSPAADAASFSASDPDVGRIFDAARETFAQNAVDVFTDCPSRERAGWLCDSFFLGRSSALLTGSSELERLFIQNYLLPDRFDDLPDGMLPMCYPSDHRNGEFIPNWAMWFVIEVGEYLERSGDRATVDALRPRFDSLVDYLWKFRNSDGLLEKLPSWVFVEWSEANKLVQDVNYPSNATWAEVLDAMDRLYGRPDLADEARRVRGAVRRQSWTGEWFCDNAVRQEDGTLKLSGKCTETCQYYMFMFGVASRISHPALWKTLVEDFGPNRRKTQKHPEIYFSNAFIGNFLRLELLSRAGLGRQLLAETKGYFSYMAERTGTLWENVGTSASCNHGFASHAAVFYVKDVLGIAKIDSRAKTVTVTVPDVPLESCEATLPVADGTITYGWRKGEDGRRDETFRAPPGWRLRRAADEWPFIVIRHTGAVNGMPEVFGRLIDSHRRHRGACDEFWFAAGDRETPDVVAKACGDFARFRPLCEDVGIALSYQQGLTLGHGEAHDGKAKPGEQPFPDDAWQKGPDGNVIRFLCPRSPDVLAYERAYAKAVIGASNPASYWLDDDLRLGVSKPMGCFCDRCIAAFNAKTGGSWTRESLAARLFSKAEREPVRAAWVDFNAESLAVYAAVVRQAADELGSPCRLAYQSVWADTIYTASSYRPLLEALSGNGRHPVGIRPGAGYYAEAEPRGMVRKCLSVAREAERCRDYGGLVASVCYEQETYPRHVLHKSPGAIMTECALALASGCDSLSLYWYSGSAPEPVEEYDRFVRTLAAARPYFERLAASTRRTRLGGVARYLGSAALEAADFDLRDGRDFDLACAGVPVTVAEARPGVWYLTKKSRAALADADKPLLDKSAVVMVDDIEMYPLASRRAKLLDDLDKATNGAFPVRIDACRPLRILPRVREDGSLDSVTLVNLSIGDTDQLKVRVRRPASERASWQGVKAASEPLAVERGASGNERVVTIPNLAGWQVATVFFD